MTGKRLLGVGAAALALALLIVVGIVRACGPDGPDPLPNGERPPAALAFSGTPLWDERRLGMTAVAGVELRGDTAVVAGDVGGGGSRLAAVDVRTGLPRWVADTGSPLRGGDGAVAHEGPGYRAENLRGVDGRPVVYGDGDGWTVLVQYTKGGRGRETEQGVAALSGADGSVRWTRRLVRTRSGAARDRRIRLLAADARVVLASVESREAAALTTVALDPATGRARWEVPDAWLYRFAGGLVLGETRGDGTGSDPREQRKNTDVLAVDAASGEQRWTLDGAFQSSHLQAAADGAGGAALVLVSETPPGWTYEWRHSIVIDPATGRTTASTKRGDDAGYLYNCADDGRTLIVCAGAEGRLVTVRPGRHPEPVAAEKRPFGKDATLRVRLVAGDRIFVTGVRSGRPDRYAVLDRAANRLGPVPPGEAAAVSERAAAFGVQRGGTSSAPDGLVVYGTAAGGAKPSGPASPDPPTAKPPRIDAAPLWTAAAGPAAAAAPAVDTRLGSIIGIDLAGDAVVYTGRDRADDDLHRLTVADAATGRTRWSVRERGAIGGGARAGFVGVARIVAAGAERLVLVPYTTAPAEGQAEGRAEEQGVAALSVRDGALRWKRPVVSGDGFVSLRAADARAFAVTATRYDVPAGGRDEMVVYSTGSRRELWRTRGMEPVGVGGGLVLAAETEQGENWTVKHLDLAAYGTADGRKRWTLAKRYRDPELLLDTGGGTVVVGTAEGAVVLDRATGRELAATYAPLSRCDGDDELAVCQTGRKGGSSPDPGRRAVTIQTGTGGAPVIRDLLETGPLTRYAAFGGWFAAVREPVKQGEKAGYLVLDAAGRRIPAFLPGRPMEIAGGFAVITPAAFQNGRSAPGMPGFSIHRVTG